MHRLAIVALLVGCAPSPASLRRDVDAELARRLGVRETQLHSEAAAAALVRERLARPLDRAGAVRIALANSPRLRAALAELGVAASGVALALGPTEIEAELRFESGETAVELDVIQDLLPLLTQPARRSAASDALAASRAIATATALALAARVELAFHDLLAATQDLELRRTAYDAADAAALIRERMFAAGNTPALLLARDRDAREQARIDLARAEATIELRRETLNALLGLSGEQTRWTITGRLADLPPTAPALDTLETEAVRASLALAAGRSTSQAAATQVGLERLRTVLPHLGLGVTLHREPGEDHVAAGPAISIGLPLLDWNVVGRRRANAELSRIEHELTATAIELRAAARSARVAALAAYQEARHLREVILPLRQQIVDETLKQYNAMNVDPFVLIVARRELVDGGAQFVDAMRRYWNAIAVATALQRGVQVDADLGPGATRRAVPVSTDQH